MKLHELDALRPTPLSSEIDRRRSDPAPLRPLPDPPRVGRRITAGVVAIAVFGLAVALGIRALDDGPSPVPAVDPWASFGKGWTAIPPPPEWRDGASIIWTGSELLYWGGLSRGSEDAPATADGWSFDPMDGRWTEMPVAPREGAFDPSVWTGTEVLFLGRSAEGLDVQAFDPAERTWRSLSSQPAIPQYGGAWSWTGTELIFVGGGDLGDVSNTNAWVLEPVSEEWRRLPDAPIPMNLSSAAWTGDEVVVVGSALDHRNYATTENSQAQAFDPATETWRELPAPPVSAQTAAAAYLGGRLVAWEQYSPASAEWLPAEGRWRSIEMGRIEGRECYASGATIDEALFTWNCGVPSALFPDSSRWSLIERPMEPVGDFSFGVGRSIAAGDVVVVEEIGTIADEEGVPFIGAPEAPMYLWAWRPPS